MNNKIISIVAMCSTALSPIMATAAYADTVPTPIADAADSATMSAMETQCDAFAAS